MQSPETTVATDRLEGAHAIAEFLGVPVRRARHLIHLGKLPVGKEGRGRIVASKRRLNEYWAQLTNGAAEK
jgi:hypothetical protein